MVNRIGGKWGFVKWWPAKEESTKVANILQHYLSQSVSAVVQVQVNDDDDQQDRQTTNR